jgi:CheY-like chemotaxis protein
MSAKPEKDVLIVDDDDAIRGMMKAALERCGLSCGAAVDGLDALNQIKVARYAVILLDLMMPRLDGRGVIGHLRTEPGERPIVIVMTAFPERDHPALDGTLVQAVVRKPFDLHNLANLLHDCVISRRSGVPGETAGSDERDSETKHSPVKKDGL